MPIRCEVTNVSKKLRQNQALAGVSIEFGEGILHGLIGPDGAGKTTTLRLLAGLLSPNEGGIRFLDGNRELDRRESRARMAYMPQQQSLYPDLSVAEHLDFFRDLYQLPREVYGPRREELLRITRLEKFQDRPAGKLSGGMYKKLGLMCSLLQSPEILLLDEPTNGVDPISRREFWELLYRLRERRILIIIATAYMDEAERCDRVHLLDRGSVLASGEPRELMHAAGAETLQAYFLERLRAAAT
ncbi:MAG: ABC transporter ATP-binding protein [Elusimicrobia bacterium]|nr:ABC transporter ATP-binding protein [Elusimicrobiota bacterium]